MHVIYEKSEIFLLLFSHNYCKIKKHGNCGAVAHLGERFHGMEEVASSILVSSTILEA